MMQAFTTVFEVRGLSQVMTAYGSVGRAQTKLAEQEQALRDKFGKLYDKLSAGDKALALRDQLSQVANAQVQMLTSSAIALTGYVRTIDRMIDAYGRWGAAIADVRDLTGANASESVKAMNLLLAAGVSESKAPSILNLSKDIYSSGGAGALGRLGIPADPNQTGLQLFDQIATKMSTMQNGFLKAQIGAQLFGEEGYRSLLPLLRLTKQQRDAAMGIGTGFSGESLNRIQEYQTRVRLLGASFSQNIVNPISDKLMVALTPIVAVLGKLVDLLGWLDQAFGGIPSWVGAMVALSVGVLLVVKTIQQLVAVYTALRAAAAAWMATQIAAEAILGGPAAWAKLATGVAVAGAVLYGTGKLMEGVNNPGASGDGQKQFVNSVNKFDNAVNRMSDSFDSIKGGAIPNGLAETDIQAIGRRNALAMIG